MMNTLNDFKALDEAIDALVDEYQKYSFIAFIAALDAELETEGEGEYIHPDRTYDIVDDEMTADYPDFNWELADSLSELMHVMDSPEWLGLDLQSDADWELHFTRLDEERTAMATLCSEYHD